jgi:hypothetical protein
MFRMSESQIKKRVIKEMSENITPDQEKEGNG